MATLRTQFALALAAASLMMQWPAVRADEAGDQYAVAAGHYAARRWELAAEEFAAFLSRYPGHTRRIKAHFYCAEALVQSAKFEEARRHFDAVIGAETERTVDGAATNSKLARQALFRAGECAYWANQPEQAQASLSQFLARYAEDSLNAYTLHYLGELALRSGDAAAARKYFRDGVDRFADGPTAGDCRLGLVKAHLQLDEPQQAKEVLAPLLKLEKHTVAANYWLGQIYKSQEQWELAASAFQTALAADSAHRGVDALRYQAAESLLRAERFQGAIDVLLRSGPRSSVSAPPPEQAYLVALAQQGLGQHDDALSTLNQLPVSPEEEVRRNIDLAKATSLLALRRYREAIEPLNQYLATVGDHNADGPSRAMVQLAICHAHLKDFAAAQAMLEKLARTAPDGQLTGATTLQLAEIAVEAGQAARGGSWYAAAASENNPADVAAPALLELARLAVTAGDLEKATTHYEQLLQRFPVGDHAVEAAFACGQVRERLQQYDAALAMYQLIFDQHLESERTPEALFRAAGTCDRLAQDTRAIELYGRLVEQFPDSSLAPAAIYGAAWCLLELERTGEAQQKFEDIRRRHPDSEYWPDATYRLALLAAESKSYDRAISLLDELIGRGDRAAESSQTTQGAGNEGQKKVAPQLVDHALYLRAQIAITQRTWDAAKRDLERIMREYSTSALALPATFLRADVAYRRGEYHEAGQRFEELAGKLNGREDAWKPMVSLRRAQLLAQDKRWDEARKVAATIAAEFPNFDQQYEADYLIGRALSAEADLAQARGWYEKVVRSSTGGKTETAAMAQWMIGETYFLQEQYRDAIREYLRVEVLYAYPHWQAAALLQAGKCYEQTEDWKHAGDAYGRLLARYSQSEFAAEARQRLSGLQARIGSKIQR